MVANCGFLTINHRAVKLRVNTNFLHLILFLPSLFSLFPLYLCSEYCVIAVHAFFHVVWMTFQDRFSAICHVLFSLCSLVSCFPNAISWNTFIECNPLEFKKLSAVHTFTNFKRFIIVAFCKPSNKSWNEAKKWWLASARSHASLLSANSKASLLDTINGHYLRSSVLTPFSSDWHFSLYRLLNKS